jgi:hypothetical protein
MTLYDLHHLLALASVVWGVDAPRASVAYAPPGEITIRLADSPTWLRVTASPAGYAVVVVVEEYDREFQALCTLERRTLTYATVPAACEAGARLLRAQTN